MAHSHAHSEPENTYFLDQLCTIAVAGLLGFTAIGLYVNGWLQTKFNLIERFHIPVLVAGIVLILLALLRAVAVWQQAGVVRAKNMAVVEDDHADHGHDHGHAHSHSHAHSHDEPKTPPPSHDDHGHDHGWSPWQYAVLIIPSVLFFLGLPADGYNLTRLNKDLQEVELENGKANQRTALAMLGGSAVMPAFKKSDKPMRLRFSELSVRASQPTQRDTLDGRTVILEGFYRRAATKDNEFQLYRVMVNCCGTDSLTLRSRIVAPEPLQGFRDGDWLRIEGELTFQKIAGKNEWMPVIQIPAMKDIEKLPPPADPNKDA